MYESAWGARATARVAPTIHGFLTPFRRRVGAILADVVSPRDRAPWWGKTSSQAASLRLMRLGADKSALGAVNRPLRSLAYQSNSVSKLTKTSVNGASAQFCAIIEASLRYSGER